MRENEVYDLGVVCAKNQVSCFVFAGIGHIVMPVAAEVPIERRQQVNKELRALTSNSGSCVKR